MEKVSKIMFVSVFTNLILAIIKMIFGFIGKSSALLADGIHSLSDLITDFFAIIGSKLSEKPADSKHPYGHGKLEYLTSIVISIVVLTLGITLITNSFQKEIVIPDIIVIVVSIFTIIAKFILSSYIINKGKKYQNNILISSGYESRTDVISSIVVLVSIILMQLSNYFEILKYADIVATIIVGLLIIKIGYSLLKENLSLLLDEQVTNEKYLLDLKKIILKEESVITIDDLIIIKLGPCYKLVLEITMDETKSLKEVHQVLDELEKRMKEYDSKIKYVTIHANPS